MSLLARQKGDIKYEFIDLTGEDPLITKEESNEQEGVDEKEKITDEEQEEEDEVLDYIYANGEFITDEILEENEFMEEDGILENDKCQVDGNYISDKNIAIEDSYVWIQEAPIVYSSEDEHKESSQIVAEEEGSDVDVVNLGPNINLTTLSVNSALGSGLEKIEHLDSPRKRSRTRKSVICGVNCLCCENTTVISSLAPKKVNSQKKRSHICLRKKSNTSSKAYINDSKSSYSSNSSYFQTIVPKSILVKTNKSNSAERTSNGHGQRRVSWSVPLIKPAKDTREQKVKPIHFDNVKKGKKIKNCDFQRNDMRPTHCELERMRRTELTNHFKYLRNELLKLEPVGKYLLSKREILETALSCIKHLQSECSKFSKEVYFLQSEKIRLAAYKDAIVNR